MTTPRTNATAQACFWPSGCSDKKRCAAFNGCVADAQNKAARLAREKPLDAAAAAGRLAGDPRAEIGVLRQIKTDLETEIAAQQRKVEALRDLLEEMLVAAENADETGYVDGVGFLKDFDTLYSRVRRTLNLLNGEKK